MSEYAGEKPTYDQEDVDKVIKLNQELSGDSKSPILEVILLRGYNLTKMDVLGTADPYVHLHAMDDDEKDVHDFGQTEVQKGLDPRFNHTFPTVKDKAAQNWVLRFTMWDQDSFVSNDFMGDAYLALSTLKDAKWNLHMLPMESKNLKDRITGYIAIAVRFIPFGDKLSIEQEKQERIKEQVGFD